MLGCRKKNKVLVGSFGVLVVFKCNSVDLVFMKLGFGDVVNIIFIEF